VRDRRTRQGKTRIGEEKCRKRRKSGRTHCDGQAPREGSGARNIVNVVGCKGKHDCSRIKTRMPLLCPTTALSLQNFQPEPKDPPPFLPNTQNNHRDSDPSRRLTAFCSYTIAHSPPPSPVSLLLQATNLNQAIAPRISSVVRQRFCSTTSASPKDLLLPQGLTRGSPRCCLPLPDLSNYLLLNAARNDCHGYAPD
jgi:hypothetical protein